MKVCMCKSTQLDTLQITKKVHHCKKHLKEVETIII